MEYGPLLKDMFQASYFRIVVIEDETTVEVCGALKVSLGCDRIVVRFTTTCAISAYRH